ncbi:MAG TPA: hypothetical protein VHW72_06035 [Candidatus Angelobacter sp.]|jgi:hypothetical protein|nr:hypothetical protein [Candidatus Angelobacter sp.]
MKSKKLIVLALLLALAASGAIAEKIPSGSHATVRLNTSLSSATAHTGEVWGGTLTHDIAEHGKVLVRAGAPVKGKVTYVNRSGRLHKPGALSLRLTSINGEIVYSSRVSREGKSHTKSNVTKIGGGAGAGALIGAVAGGGKGAAIGAGAGAAAGTGVAAATGKEEVRIPAESVLTFTITGAK